MWRVVGLSLIGLSLMSCTEESAGAGKLDFGQASNSIIDTYNFTTYCPGIRNWYCHVECCNGYVQDGCTQDSPNSANSGAAYEYEYATAHKHCDDQALAWCAGQNSVPTFAQACWFQSPTDAQEAGIAAGIVAGVGGVVTAGIATVALTPFAIDVSLSGNQCSDSTASTPSNNYCLGSGANSQQWPSAANQYN